MDIYGQFDIEIFELIGGHSGGCASRRDNDILSVFE